MPTISMNRDALFELLGRKYTDEEFDSLCFDYGLELDEVTSEKEMRSKELGRELNEKTDTASEEVIYKVEVPANRYDILCSEGLARCLLIFQEKMKSPVYKAVAPKSKPMERMLITAATKEIRPYCVAAILRNVKFTKDRYASFIDLQDKLHQNLCRKRSLVAIGTHDYDTIKGPFLYDARKPENISFVPLNQTKKFRADHLMEFYSHDSHLKAYLPLIRDSAVYPVIYDTNGVLLSLPPIINGDHSKITLNTRNVFIECTATDITKAKIVLDTVVSMFSQYCEKVFEIEQVEVKQADGSCVIYPTLAYRKESCAVEDINKFIGVNIAADKIESMLTRMGLESKLSADKKTRRSNNSTNSTRYNPSLRHNRRRSGRLRLQQYSAIPTNVCNDRRTRTAEQINRITSARYCSCWLYRSTIIHALFERRYCK